MNRNDTLELLITITDHDGRDIDDAIVDVWAAALADVALVDGYDAVTDYYADAPGRRIGTDDVIAFNRKRYPRSAGPVPAGVTRAFAGGGIAGDDPHWGRRSNPALEALHAEANTVSCTYCGQIVGNRCVNKITGNATKIPHTPRLRDARQAHQEVAA